MLRRAALRGTGGAPGGRETAGFELRILTRVDRLERQRFADPLLAGFALTCEFAFEPLAFAVKLGNTALGEFQLRRGVCMLFFQRLTLVGGLLQQLFR